MNGLKRFLPACHPQTPMIVLIPAIVLLVSGSIGFRGLAAMTAGELLVGAQQFLQMFVVALTIFAGIVVGNTIVRPEPTL